MLDPHRQPFDLGAGSPEKKDDCHNTPEELPPENYRIQVRKSLGLHKKIESIARALSDPDTLDTGPHPQAKAPFHRTCRLERNPWEQGTACCCNPTACFIQATISTMNRKPFKIFHDNHCIAKLHSSRSFHAPFQTNPGAKLGRVSCRSPCSLCLHGTPPWLCNGPQAGCTHQRHPAV